MSNPINIIAYEEDSNLREVSWSQLFLETVKKEYKLRHGQAVLYRNVAQDRWRLVACFYGLAVLILPPVDKEARLSLDLEVSRFLRKFSGNHSKTDAWINQNVERNTKRLKRKGKRK